MLLASSRISRIAPVLAVACALGLSACSQNPQNGMMLDHAPTGSDENGKKVYAIPTPDASPAPARTPPPATVGPVLRPPNPFPSYGPFDPWYPYPGMRPSATPIAPPSPKPTAPNPSPDKKPWWWPTAKPSARPSAAPSAKPNPPSVTVKPVAPVAPVKPNPPAAAAGRIEVPTNLFAIFTQAFAQAIGVYDNGRLVNPDALPLDGQGFLKIFRERKRNFGSLDLISVIEAAAKELHRDIPATEVVQIGDISDKDGGRLGGHGSHQNGLDADVVYFRKDHRVMPITGSSPGSTGFDEDFVDRKGALVANFDVDANWRMIQILVSTGRIDRIFADQHIKKAFCEYAVAKGMREEWGETLRKLRHWPNHQDHMHVRLTCPPNSKQCRPIAAIPAGDGCAPLLGGRNGVIRTDGELLDPNDHGAVADEHGC